MATNVCAMEPRFIGCGDAFGSGGRFNTCCRASRCASTARARRIAFSGDTEWSDDLAAAARGADLFICECSSWERPLSGHINDRTLAPQLAMLGPNA
jgi:hypothetical protein